MAASPQIDADIADLAHWYKTEGRDLELAIRRIKDRLTAHMIDNGDLPGLGLAYRTEWAPDAVAEFPELVRQWSLTADVVDASTFDRLLELVTEEVPEAIIRQESKIDGRRANQVILRGGQAGERLRALKTDVPRLVVK
jgi:hypothetical protein